MLRYTELWNQREKGKQLTIELAATIKFQVAGVMHYCYLPKNKTSQQYLRFSLASKALARGSCCVTSTRYIMTSSKL